MTNKQFWFYILCRGCNGKLGVFTNQIRISDAGVGFVQMGHKIVCPMCRTEHNQNDVVFYGTIEDEVVRNDQTL